jgi:hypothetical protein
MAEVAPVLQAPEPSSRVAVVPRRATVSGRAAAALIYALVHAVDATLRYRWITHATAEAALRDGPVIFSIWHNRLALSLRLYARLCRQYRRSGRWLQSPPRMAAMVSASRDGGMLARTLEHFGVQPVRGSSSRRGPQALLELTSWGEQGYDLAVTPDGPRGPRYVVQDGVVAVAQLTGLPIVPVSFRVSWTYVVSSWDRFHVPLPFGRCLARLGEPLRVARDASDAGRTEARAELERRLRAITEDDAPLEGANNPSAPSGATSL